jgi:hypothetical protein
LFGEVDGEEELGEEGEAGALWVGGRAAGLEKALWVGESTVGLEKALWVGERAEG